MFNLWVSVSGGADSTAMAIRLWQEGIRFKMIFSDTGAEFPETYFSILRLKELVGRPLKVVSNGSFFQWINQCGFLLPSVKARWCTRILKIDPIENELDDGDRVAIGYRADEPKRHESLRPYQVAPLVDLEMGKKEVKDLCLAFDLLTPLYGWRTNVSYFCCPFQRKSDWLGLLRNHPSLYALAEQWEGASLRNSRLGWTHWKLRDLREADHNQVKLFPEPDGEPCLICSI